MKKMWCDLCGKQITEDHYVRLEASVRDCNLDGLIPWGNFDNEGRPLPLGPFEVHKECLFEAFADFQGKNKLPEGGTTHGA